MKRMLVLTCSLLMAGTLPWAQAQEGQQNCIEVQVNGYKAPDYNCLSQQLSNPDGTAAQQKNQEAMQVPVHKRPPNQVGLATPAATSVRMGNTFGTSVKPQRPTP